MDYLRKVTRQIGVSTTEKTIWWWITKVSWVRGFGQWERVFMGPGTIGEEPTFINLVWVCGTGAKSKRTPRRHRGRLRGSSYVVSFLRSVSRWRTLEGPLVQLFNFLVMVMVMVQKADSWSGKPARKRHTGCIRLLFWSPYPWFFYIFPVWGSLGWTSTLLRRGRQHVLRRR